MSFKRIYKRRTLIVAMDAEEIKLGDWHRMLFGESPPLYLLEVVLRVAIIYVLILVAMRSLGKRMTAEVGRTEIVARVSLAAAVGLTIQRPQRGILGSAVIALVIVLVGRWLALLAFKHPRFEKAFQGNYAALVKDGILNLPLMKRTRITRESLNAALRGENVRHLGQVKRFYLEANGKFSLISATNEVPGLSVIPEWDLELQQRQQQTDIEVCKSCGSKWDPSLDHCTGCRGVQKERALLLPKDPGE
jgi:uncharacterized membrane protein YcaP (DUF421 family)